MVKFLARSGSHYYLRPAPERATAIAAARRCGFAPKRAATLTLADRIVRDFIRFEPVRRGPKLRTLSGIGSPVSRQFI